jgi:hypothetical protein
MDPTIEKLETIYDVQKQLDNAREEISSLKKKMTEMYDFSQIVKAYRVGKHDGRKRSLDSFLVRHTIGRFSTYEVDESDLRNMVKPTRLTTRF